MEIEILMGLVILVLFIGPIIIIFRKIRNEKLFHQIATDYGIEPNITDFNEAFLLGLDMKRKKFLILFPINRQSNLISLTEIANCELRTENRKYLPGKINFISLVLHYKKKEVPPFEIVFYNLEDSNPEEEMPLQLARKWEKVIKKQLML